MLRICELSRKGKSGQKTNAVKLKIILLFNYLTLLMNFLKNIINC